MPLEEPSVPVQDIDLDQLNIGQQQCLTSEEVVISAGTSTDTDSTNLLVLPPGSDLDKLAFTVLSRLRDLQSVKASQTTIQSQSMPAGLSQQALILLMSANLQFRVFQQAVPLVSRVLFCLMSVNLQCSQKV